MTGRGEWNAYVESGDTVEERRRRLAEVPEPLRAGVERHVRLAFALRPRTPPPHQEDPQ